MESPTFLLQKKRFIIPPAIEYQIIQLIITQYAGNPNMNIMTVVINGIMFTIDFDIL